VIDGCRGTPHLWPASWPATLVTLGERRPTPTRRASDSLKVWRTLNRGAWYAATHWSSIAAGGLARSAVAKSVAICAETPLGSPNWGPPSLKLLSASRVHLFARLNRMGRGPDGVHSTPMPESQRDDTFGPARRQHSAFSFGITTDGADSRSAT